MHYSLRELWLQILRSCAGLAAAVDHEWVPDSLLSVASAGRRVRRQGSVFNGIHI